MSYALKAKLLARQEATRQAVLLTLGDCYRLMGRYPQAIDAYQQLLKDPARQGIDRAYITVKLAEAYERVNSLPLAIRYAYQTLSIAHQTHNPTLYSGLVDGASMTLCRLYAKTHQLDSALYYGQQALRLSKNFHNKEGIQNASWELAGLYAQRHKYDSAYSYQSRYIAYKDSLNNEEVTRKTTAARFDDQMSRQQSQIALLQKDKQIQAEEARRQRQLLYGSLAVLLLIGGLLALLYRNNRQKQKANVLLEGQKQEIQHQRDQTQQALTELKATQAQLIQKEKMASLGELTAGIAHEIQNPLNFVNNFSEVSTELVEELKEGPFQQLADPEKEYASGILGDLKQNLHKIHQHGQRASGIIKGMLEHS